MKLYEISREIEEALVQDDEAFDPAKLQALKVEFEAKLEAAPLRSRILEPRATP